MALGDRVSILGDPLPQTRPRPQQGLVGDLHRRHPGTRIVIEGEETGRRPLVDDNLRRPTRISEVGARRAATGGFTVDVDHDELFEDAANRPSAVRIGCPGRADRRGRRWPGRCLRVAGSRPSSSDRSGRRSASSYSVNCNDGSAAGWLTTVATSSATSAGSAIAPSASTGRTIAASSSAGDIGGTATVASPTSAPNRWTASGRS